MRPAHALATMVFALSPLAPPLLARADDEPRAAPQATEAPPQLSGEDVRLSQMPTPGGSARPMAVVVDRDGFQLAVRGFGQLYVAPYAGKDALVAAGDPVEFAGLRVRRLGLGVEGRGPKGLSFGVWTDLVTEPILSQAWIAWAPVTAFGVEAGVVRVPFSRSALQSSAELTFSERPHAVDRLVPDRQPGIAIYGGLLDAKISYRAGWFNGSAPDQLSRGPDHPAGLFAGRLSIAPLGRLRTPQSDLARGPLRAELSLSAMRDAAAAYTSLALGADLTVQLGGAALLVEYIRDTRTPVSQPVTAPTLADAITRTGLIAQASYQVWGPLEVAARGELVDDNSGLEDVGDFTAVAAGVHANFEQVKVGVDWYHRSEKFGLPLANDTALALVQGRF